jgi:DNA-binding response OmpR family regulator
MKIPKLLIVDDNYFELESFKYYFSDYNLTTYSDPELACREAIHNEQFDIIILDILMNNMNGLEIFKYIKESPNKDAYVIAYTALTERAVYETINELGFDEIVEKPVNIELLGIKINSILKKLTKTEEKKNSFFIEDKINFSYSLNGNSLELTYKEYEILKLLIDKAGKILTHGEIYKELYGNEERSDNIIKSHMKNLRFKINKADPTTEYIKTIPTKGYILNYGKAASLY